MESQGLSKNELAALVEISKGITSPNKLAEALKKSKAQIYRITKKLIETGFIEKEKRKLIFQKHSFIPIIIDILNKNPKIIPLLADSGILILKETLEGSTIEEIELRTSLKKAIIYRKLNLARKFSIINKAKNKYLLNSRVWPELKGFLEDYKRYSHSIDFRLSPQILIRGKYKGAIIAESNREIENSVLTGFSAYSKHGINILMPSNYYHMPKKKLSIKEIFMDSLIILKDDKDYRKLLYAMLFYLKHRPKLSGIKNEFINKFNAIIHGEKINGYPSLKEIKEKAKQYNNRNKRADKTGKRNLDNLFSRRIGKNTRQWH